MVTDELLTPQEVAERLKVKTRTVQEWLRTGRLAGLKLGKRWRIRESDLSAFLFPPLTIGGSALLPVAPVITPEERVARIKAARGALAHVPGSVDEFLRRKHEDIEWENRRWNDREDADRPKATSA
jgi:excisionase family DNA binding protein